MSELLCFVTDNCNVLPVDYLVKICVDFYSESEIINARSAVDSTGVRLPKRNRLSNRLRLTMEDIVKCVLDPSATVETIDLSAGETLVRILQRRGVESWAQ